MSKAITIEVPEIPVVWRRVIVGLLLIAISVTVPLIPDWSIPAPFQIIIGCVWLISIIAIGIGFIVGIWHWLDL